MKDKCFDIGTVQAFTDGELDPGKSERLLKHVAACETCAAQLTACEEESSFAFSVLDDELNVLVPTERLRAKVFASIDEIDAGRRRSWFAAFAAGISGLFSLRGQGLAMAAAGLVLVGVFVFGLGILDQSPESVAVNTPAQVAEQSTIVEIPQAAEATSPSVAEQVRVAGSDSPERAESRGARPYRARQAVYRPSTSDDPVRVTNAAADAGDASIVSEGSYIQTIATLDETVAYGKELLRPSERVAFERDLAVVNDAIVKMKDEVRRNPDNQAAREVLKASYQNKVDLLNSVAEKTELMASLQ